MALCYVVKRPKSREQRNMQADHVITSGSVLIGYSTDGGQCEASGPGYQAGSIDVLYLLRRAF